MLLVEVYVVCPQPAKAPLHRLRDPAGARAAVLGVMVDRGRELGGDHDLVTKAGEHLAQVLLRTGLAVDVSGVEEGDARVERGVDHGLGPVLIAARPEVVAAQPDQADVERSQLARLHDRTLRRARGGGRGRARQAVRDPSVYVRGGHRDHACV